MIRLGIVGLGRAATALLPSILRHPEVEVVALAEPQQELRELFCEDFGVRGYSALDALVADSEVDVVYVATPHQLHREHVLKAVAANKHVLVEKPMALTLEECDEMIAAAEAARVVLLVGHTNGFDPPVLALRELASNGRFGTLKMLNCLNYSDFLYRPRRPEELDTALGGGIMYNQLPHQVEMVRTIADRRVVRVSAVGGAWDGERPTEAAVAALLRLEGDVVATLLYSGYAHLDNGRLFRGLDRMSDPLAPFAGRRAALAAVTPVEESKLRADAGYPARRAGILAFDQPVVEHERFGVVIAGFEHADVVPSPLGLTAFTDDGPEAIEVPFGRGGGARATVLDELCAAIAGGLVVHDGRSARTTLAVCLAALESSRLGREVEVIE